MAQGTKGSIVQIIGTVVDVEFPPDDVPGIFNALELELHGEKMVLEVEQQVGDARLHRLVELTRRHANRLALERIVNHGFLFCEGSHNTSP